MPQAFPRPHELFLILPVLAAGIAAMFLGLVVSTGARTWPPTDPNAALRGPLIFWSGVAILVGDAIYAAWSSRGPRRAVGRRPV